MTTLIVGCGFLGRALASRLLRRDPDEIVFGTTRTQARAGELEAAGIRPILADVLDPRSMDRLPRTDRIVVAVGYDRAAGASREDVGIAGRQNLLRSLRSSRWDGRLVVSSSTSVYGQTQGEWVDEAAPTEPNDEAGRVALRAEEWVRGTFASATILRFSGLYGAGRIIGRTQLEKGGAIGGDPDRWLNLIHVNDASKVVMAVLDAADPGSIYVASDDRPILRREYYDLAARKLSLAAPRYAPTPPGRTEEPNRRVRNARMKSELSITLECPEAVCGLDVSLA
jgi:nucleoside-diphosphate-sugar epimerase